MCVSTSTVSKPEGTNTLPFLKTGSKKLLFLALRKTSKPAQKLLSVAKNIGRYRYPKKRPKNYCFIARRKTSDGTGTLQCFKTGPKTIFFSVAKNFEGYRYPPMFQKPAQKLFFLAWRKMTRTVPNHFVDMS